MQISEVELSDFIYEKAIKPENKTLTRYEADLFAHAMLSAAKTTEKVLDDIRKNWYS